MRVRDSNTFVLHFLPRDSRYAAGIADRDLFPARQQPSSGVTSVRHRERRPRFLLALGPLLILAVTLWAYGPTLANGFTMDDRAVAMASYDDGRENTMVAELQPLADYFRSHYWRGHKEASDLYRPMTVLSYALCFRLAGRPADERGQARPQHLVNVLLHLLATSLVWIVMLRLAGAFWPAVAATLVFGLHAIHSEVVAAVVGRAELLAFCFGMTGAWLSLRSIGALRSWRPLFWVAGSLAFFLAYCSKESAVAWVWMLPLLSVVARGRAAAEGRQAVLASTVWPALAVTLVPLAVFLLFRHNALAAIVDQHEVRYLVNPLSHVAHQTRIFTAVTVLWHGLLRCLLPIELASDHGVAVFDLVGSALDPAFLVPAFVLLGSAVLGVLARRRAPLLALAVAVFFGFSFLTSNIPFPIGTMFGERLYYTPSLAVGLLVAWLLDDGRVRRNIVTGVAILWLALSTSVIRERNAVWRSNETLFTTDARRQPRSARLQLGAAHFAASRAERIRLLNRALDAYPDYVEALLNLAGVLVKAGDLQESERLLRRALSARHLDPAAQGFAIRHSLLPILYMQGRAAEGARELDAAIGLARGGDWARLIEFGEFLRRFGKPAEARSVLETLARDARVPAATRRAARALTGRR